MRKSRLETAESRQRIVAQASKVFLEKGIAATGIADVMVAAGMTQGGFYRHFSSKEQLVVEANAFALTTLMEGIGSQVAGKPPREALDLIVRMYLYQRQNRDATTVCPMASLVTELPHADVQVRTVVNMGFQRMVGYVAGFVQQLNVPEPLSTAEALMSTMLGAVTVARASMTESGAASVLANAYRIVNLVIDGPHPQGAE